MPAFPSGRDRLDHHEGVSVGEVIGDGEVDAGLVAGGTRLSSRSLAPPVSTMVGLPEGSLTTPMSFQNTPLRKPVPSALEQASLAAKRLA